MYIHISLSLSIYIHTHTYIYIYTHIHTGQAYPEDPGGSLSYDSELRYIRNGIRPIFKLRISKFGV